MRHLAKFVVPLSSSNAAFRTWCGAGDNGPLDFGDSIFFEAALSDCLSCTNERSDALHDVMPAAAIAVETRCVGASHVAVDEDALTCQCGDREIESAAASAARAAPPVDE